MEKEIEKELTTLAENVKSITEKTAKIEAVEKSITDIKTAQDEAKKAADLNQKALDDILANQKKNAAGEAQKDFGQELYSELTKKEAQLKEFKASKKGFGEISLKAVGNLSSSGSLTGSYLVPPTIVPGVFIKPYETRHVRDFVPVGTTNSNIIRYIQDDGPTYTPAVPTTVAEGATKPQIDRSLEIKDTPVRKIATYFRVPEEMIDDIPYLSSFLSQVGVQEVMLVEDAQLLYGDGTGQNLSGLFTNATAFAAGAAIVPSPNNYDVIGAAKLQIRKAHFQGPAVAMISPLDYYTMRFGTKDTTKNYMLMGGGNGIDMGLNVDGTRIIENTNVAEGDFLVFDPSRVQIFDRMGTTVRFYDQDQDNAIKNLITIVIEKRLALAVYYTKALVKGTFAAAITDLTS